MKINKRNIIIPAFMLVSGAALVGTVTGTVAWYQYSTRATVAYVGTSVSTTHNLKIKVGDGDFKTDLSNKDVATYLASVSNTDTLTPVTTGAMEKNAELPSTLYGNPVYQYEDYSTFKPAEDTDVVILPLTLKLTEADGTTAKEGVTVYLADLEMNDSLSTGKTSVLDALRVHLASESTKALFAASDEDDDVVTSTHGALDLDGLNGNDKVPGFVYDEDSDSRGECDYGSTLNGTAITAANNKQSAYSNGNLDYYVDDSVPTLDNKDNAINFGTTDSNGELAITMTVFLEGWASLDGKNCWELSTIGAGFQVGVRFAVDA